MLLLAASKLKVLARDCLFVGDSELDQQAAAAGQIRFVAYGDGLQSCPKVSTHFELARLLLDAGEPG
jgi:beta-phosphoglucomutase-like phosphatase (HAD superfamily)